MKIYNPTGFSSSLTGSFSGSVKGTFEGSFTGESLNNISGAFDSVSASLASGKLNNTTDTLDGDLTVTGTITAQEFHTEFVSASIIYESGSTQFGNSADDTHIFTGSVNIQDGDVLIRSSQPGTNLILDNTGTGDPIVNFALSGVNQFTIGVDDSDSDKFKIATGGGLSAAAEFTLDSSGNVGIGNTSPAAKLDVSGNVYVRNGAGLYADLLAGFTSGVITLNSNTNFIVPSGNVGIGTTSPGTKLHLESGVSDGIIVRTSANVEPFMTLQRNAGSNGVAVLRGMDGGDLKIDTGATGAAQSTKVTIGAGGNVKIGSGTAGHKLEVSGSINIEGSSYSYKINDINVLGVSATYTQLYNPEGATGVYVGDSADRSNYYDNNYHYFRVAGGTSTLGVWNTSGLGIGTSTPGSSLDVVSNAGGNGVSIRTRSNNDWGWLIYNSYDNSERLGEIGINRTAANTGDIYFTTANGGSSSTRMVLKSDGDLGLNLTDPTQKLSIRGNQVFTNLSADGVTNALIAEISSQARGYSNQGSNMASIQFRTNPSVWYRGEIAFLTNGTDGTDPNVSATERMRIDSSGRVGINTTPSLAGVRLHTYNNSTDAYNIFESSANKWVFGEAGGNCQIGGLYGVHTGINVNTAGRVGIGVASASYKLHVVGDILSQGTHNNILIHDGSDDNGWFSQLKPDGTEVGRLGWDGFSSSGAYYTGFQLSTRSTSDSGLVERLVVKSDGNTYFANTNVGIGNSSPSDKLSIKNLVGDAGILLEGPSQTLRIDQNSIRTSTTSPINIFTNNTSGANSLYVSNDGRFGVGTTSPTSGTKLDVNGKIRSVGDIIMAQPNPRIDYDNGSSGALRFFSISANSETMRINSDAEVSINTTAANATLNIAQTGTQRLKAEFGNSNTQGTAQRFTIVRHYPVVSSGNQLIIPFVSQGNLNSTTLIKIMGHAALWNSSDPRAFTATIAVGHLQQLYSLSTLESTGNVSSVTSSGMNVIINFTTAYTSGTANGIYVTLEYMTNVLSYSINTGNITMN